LASSFARPLEWLPTTGTLQYEITFLLEYYTVLLNINSLIWNSFSAGTDIDFKIIYVYELDTITI
jgi:hypothetical protein